LPDKSILIFDEFTSGHEYLAFKDFISVYQKRFRILTVAGRSYQHVAIELL